MRENSFISGARVTAVDPQVQRMRENLGSGQNLTILQGDVASDSDCSATVTETEKTFGKIDGLIHCGAAHSSARWDELEAEEMNRILAINVTGSFQISKAVAKHMKEFGEGLDCSHDICVRLVRRDRRQWARRACICKL